MSVCPNVPWTYKREHIRIKWLAKRKINHFNWELKCLGVAWHSPSCEQNTKKWVDELHHFPQGKLRFSHYSRNDIALSLAIRNVGKYVVKGLPDYFVINRFQEFLLSTLQSSLQSKLSYGSGKRTRTKNPHDPKTILASGISAMFKYERMLHVFDRPHVSMM